MINYFSLSNDAKIGIRFDKHWANSELKNKCLSCWEGLKKMISPKSNTL